MGVLAFALFFLSIWRIVKLISLKDKLLAAILTWPLLLIASCLVGSVLSSRYTLDSTAAWVKAGALLFCLSFIVEYLWQRFTNKTESEEFTASNPLNLKAEWLNIKSSFNDSNNTSKVILILLLGLGVIIYLNNSILSFAAMPQNYDAMNTHLARIAHYLHEKHLCYIGSQMWTQDSQSYHISLVSIFFFISGGKIEQAYNLPQFFSAIHVSICIYWISRNMQVRGIWALAAAVSFLVYPISMAESTTPQNDMVVASICVSVLASALAFQQSKKILYLIIALLISFFAFSYKPNALFFIAPTFLFFSVNKSFFRSIRKHLITASLGLVLLVGSSIILYKTAGYQDNIKRYGSILGPKERITLYSFPEGLSFAERLHEAKLTLIRFFFNYNNLDGLPNSNEEYIDWNSFFKNEIIKTLSINIEELANPKYAFTDFNAIGSLEQNEDSSTFGFAGLFLLFLPIFIGVIACYKNRQFYKLLSIVVFFVLLICYQVPYNIYNVRYFLMILPILQILAFVAWDRIVQVRLVPMQSLVLIILPALWAGFINVTTRRDNNLFYPIQNGKTLFTLNRVEQLCRNNYRIVATVQNFHAYGIKNKKIATVIGSGDFEYVLHDTYYTNNFTALNPDMSEKYLPIPSDADYLLFLKGAFPAMPDDIYLGNEFSNNSLYLRKLR